MSKLTPEGAREIAIAVKKLARAEVDADKDTEPDSMGSYYEEMDLIRVLLKYLGGIQ